MYWYVFIFVLFAVSVGYEIGKADGQTHCQPVVVNNFGSANADQE